MTSDVGGSPLPESLSGPCRRLRYHELNTHKVTKGTQCFRNFSISNDLFTTIFTAPMGRGKIYCGVIYQSQKKPGFLAVTRRGRQRTEYFAAFRIWYSCFGFSGAGVLHSGGSRSLILNQVRPQWSEI